MALPILDGNQTSVTLATTVSGGAHYPNHIIASSVTISSLPAISGTVTANVSGQYYSGSGNEIYPISVGKDGQSFNQGDGRVAVEIVDRDGNSIVQGGNLPISGTVTANVSGSVNIANSQFQSGNESEDYKFIVAGGTQVGTNILRPINLDSSQRILISSVTVGSLPSISGTVTANNPNGTLATRFGSVTTANTAQITTAVTNTSRKYLLCQNNQTGTSAGTVTIGIGFTPTTTQGIQLISGASYTADSFVPTGAVYWLGAVTGASFTILEG